MRARAKAYREANPDKVRKAVAANTKKWRKEHPEMWAAQNRRNMLKQNYGITADQYEEMLISQNWMCAICRRPEKSGKRMSVDHDHASGVVRGLLCAACNRGLGCFEDEPLRLVAAVDYLGRVPQWRS